MSPLRRRFAEVARSEPLDLGLACLLVHGEVDPDLDVDRWLAALDALAGTARPLVPVTGPAAQAEGLRVALGEHAGFSGFAEDYEDLRASLLPEVLRRRRGLPLLLSVVWLEVAARLSVPAYAVALPGRIAVGVGDPEDVHVVVDPFAGGRVVEPPPLHLPPVEPLDLLLRLLTNVRALTTRQPPSLDVARTRLWAVELSLLLPRHPLELRRERGELLVRLGDHLGGADELEAFALAAEQVDETVAATARREARMARAQLN